MRSIDPELTDELIRFNRGRRPYSGRPYPVQNYRRLVEHVARLAYLNKDHLFFFRGQDRDYTSRSGGSTYYPSIYRDEYLQTSELLYRFEVLEIAAKQLRDAFAAQGIVGHKDLAKRKYIQWSILQHYNVCATPLLDFTQSLRVACSFAQQFARKGTAILAVFGLPYLTNRISINSEHEIVDVRLLSICPPDAIRPQFQEGYLAGTEDITTEFESKTDLDFRNRLVAKFRIPATKAFWGRGLSSLPKSVLFPKADPIGRLCSGISTTVIREILPGEIGQFVREWAELEARIAIVVQRRGSPPMSIGRAIEFLHLGEMADRTTIMTLHKLRRFRNRLIHQPSRITPQELDANLARLKGLKLGDR